ncbi:MAG: methyltransferase domain-containing protein [Methanothrix sp.]
MIRGNKWMKGRFGRFLNSFRETFFASQIDVHIYIDRLSGKRGLEVGGPSRIFNDSSIMPIYSVIGELDGCNFSETTIWEGCLNEGLNYRYHKNKKQGYQYICEATDLSKINNNVYDFVLASHILEHTANPLKAIREWTRVLKDGGYILLVVPLKDKTFDHNRPVTLLQHLIDDYERDVKEDDLTHLPEILKLHDLKMDAPAGNAAFFMERSLCNYRNRCLHHHVFDVENISKLLEFQNLDIISTCFAPPYHIIVFAEKHSRRLR